MGLSIEQKVCVQTNCLEGLDTALLSGSNLQRTVLRSPGRCHMPEHMNRFLDTSLAN